MIARNPHSSDPLTRQEVEQMVDRLSTYWEDIPLVTGPNQYPVESVGNIKAALRMLLRGDAVKA